MMQLGYKALRQALQTLVIQTAYWPRTWHLINESASGWTLAWGVLIVVQGVLPAVPVYLTKLLVDNLMQLIGTVDTWEALMPVSMLVLLTGATMLATELLHGLVEWVRVAQSEYVQDHIKGLVHQKSAVVDLAFYETPGDFDKLEQARNDAAGHPLALLENIGSLVQNSVTLLAMAALVIPYGLWLPLVLLVSTLPALFVSLRYNRTYHQWWERTTPDRRWTHYFDMILTEGAVTAELRLFGLNGYFLSLYQGIRKRLREERLGLLQRQGVARLGASLGALLISGAAMAWMVLQTAQGILTMGDLVLFYQAFQRGQGLLRTMLGSLSQVYSNTLFLENLFGFLDFQNQVIDPCHPVSVPKGLKTGITFRNVRFDYQGKQRPILQEFNLFVPANKIVAIVGPNGAGKTTFTKLLCRYYDVEKGQIELDGQDIRGFQIEELRRQITVLFQFPMVYIATASQNIAFGDLDSSPTRTNIEAASQRAGIHDMVSRLPMAYETLLGRAFEGGVELSGGERQRIAMARAFFRQAPIIILDEPTSHMDSWSEAKWFENFRALAEGRTSIVITHRFTIAMRADIIHVMDQGRIVESGSHDELLALDGIYAKSWREQMHAGFREDAHV